MCYRSISFLCVAILCINSSISAFKNNKLERILEEFNSLKSAKNTRNEVKTEDPNCWHGDVMDEVGDSTTTSTRSIPMDLVSAGFQEPNVKIGSFNIQVFGDSKYGKKDVVESLLKILPRYDIILVQEIRDSDGSSFPSLVQDLNDIGNDLYDYVISERLGRSSSKEQYAFIYRNDIFGVESTYTYNDVGDKFEREPYGVIFTSTKTELCRFGILGIHTKPTDAVAEIDSLVDVFDDFSSTYNIKDVIITGDFNGDCKYVPESAWSDIRLRNDPRFTWLIKDGVDTTVKDTDCAYDRMIISGEVLEDSVVKGSAQPYRFDVAQGLTYEEVTRVSDHYPVEVTMYGRISDELQSHISVKESITVSGLLPLDQVISLLPNVASNGYLYKAFDNQFTGTTGFASLKKCEVNDILNELQSIQSILTDEVIATVGTLVADGRVNRDIDSFPGLPKYPSKSFCLNIQYTESNFHLTISKSIL